VWRILWEMQSRASKRQLGIFQSNYRGKCCHLLRRIQAANYRHLPNFIYHHQKDFFPAERLYDTCPNDTSWCVRCGCLVSCLGWTTNPLEKRQHKTASSNILSAWCRFGPFIVFFTKLIVFLGTTHNAVLSCQTSSRTR
jgi:hypothetical protein